MFSQESRRDRCDLLCCVVLCRHRENHAVGAADHVLGVGRRTMFVQLQPVELVREQKTKASHSTKNKSLAFIDRNARALETSSSSSFWRLYPERSIASHSICGSGRLFPGFKRETRCGESGMAELSSCGEHEFGRGQGYPVIIQMSREYCKLGKCLKTDCRKGPASCLKRLKVLQNGQVLTLICK
jgi:hypothetical protein